MYWALASREVCVLGKTDPQLEILDAGEVCGHLIKEGTFFQHVATLGDRFFADEDFADLYDGKRGRYSVPPALLAKIQLLQSFEGTSDRETLERVRCDLRWKVALGLSLTDEGFDFTVLTYFRQRLRRSERPRRVFERFKEIASEAGLLTKRQVRVVDSTPVLSAVQTQDTVSLIRGALRRLLATLEAEQPEVCWEIEAAFTREDYDQIGKPLIDWDDQEARSALVDELVLDALAALRVLEGHDISYLARTGAELLATVAGQDVEFDEERQRYRIRRGVARDRIISTVDTEARHGRKSKRALFDGYKAHVATEPETEIITEVRIAPANVPEMAVVPAILPELAEQQPEITVVGDAAYGSGAAREVFAQAGVTVISKAPPDRNSFGGFPKSAFRIDLIGGTITCPAGNTTSRPRRRVGVTRFRFPLAVCARCPLQPNCTSSPRGRTVSVGPHERLLAEARAFQDTDKFKSQYRAQRPLVERSIYRLMRRGGRKARYRGVQRVGEQMSLKAAAENFATMVGIGLIWTGPEGWGLT
jgi:transposase